MNTIFMLTLQQTATQGNAFMQFLPLILIVVVFMVLHNQTPDEKTKRIEKIPG